jgi:glycosyltransferase involved in cell wall biosynthesis
MRLVIDLQAAQGGSAGRGIGRYSRELAFAMARKPRGHDVIVALSSALMETADDLAVKLSAFLPRDNIRIWHPPCNTAPAYYDSPQRPFAETLRAQFFASLHPDLVHVGSLFDGLGDDVVSALPRQLHPLPVVATCYDLIPLLHHEDFFGLSPAPSRHSRFYYRAIVEMSLCEGLLAISESCRREVTEHLPFPAERAFNIRAGIGPQFQPAFLSDEERANLLRRYGTRDGFIMFLSADSPTKNEAGLVAAYARLPPELRARHQLLVAGQRDPKRLYQTAAQFGIQENDLVHVLHVQERDLPALYSVCGLFVCPSRHEGFGLPLGEAMACGAPAIASNTTSLPEVIGRADATFDPDSPDDIAACMRKVLENPVFRAELAAYGPVQAGRFTWETSADRAWDALEAIHADRIRLGKTRLAGLLQKRPSLAFVSPLPPQPNSVAGDSSELLPSLARYYDITLVSEEETTERRLWGFPRLTPKEFLRKADQFERVLYQVGSSCNSVSQTNALIPRVPGMVVLHDVFLSNYFDRLAHTNGNPNEFRSILLQAHGYPALRFDAEHGRNATLEHYPCTLPIVENAVGVIQHSRYEVAVLEEHFGAEVARDVAVIRRLRQYRARPDRKTARAVLKLPGDAFVVCSFGHVTRQKCPTLVTRAWRQAGLRGRLIFVGAAEKDLEQELADDTAGVAFTGRLARGAYDLWLAAADVAVQWRSGSRRDSSGTVADVLMAGVPMIVNRHGSAAELPENVVLGLPDDADACSLAAALLALHDDPARRASLGAAGHDYARRESAQGVIAQQYHEVIERAYALSSTALVQSMQSDIKAVTGLPDGLTVVARCVARSFPSTWHGRGRPRLLVDVSELARRDHASGIQRVVREIACRALETPPDGWRGEAVRVHDGRLRHTYSVPLAMLGHTPLALPEAPFDVRTGDILLCADVNAELTATELDELRRLRLAGLRIVLLVHDLLPLRHPELFPAHIAKLVAAWYSRMLSIADSALCTSRLGAGDVIEWLDEQPGRRKAPLPIGVAHLGADFRIRAGGCSVSPETLVAFNSAQRRPTIIMVGTVEPRKAYPQVLSAFERLWGTGEDLGLIIVGKQGWDMETFASRLERSSERGKRLHWLQRCGDAELRALYGASKGLLMASHHEGFGLPIVEALHADLPVLARDLPVFREFTGSQACYFSGDDPLALAESLQRWAADDFKPLPTPTASLTWDDSYRDICDAILGNRWYATWRPRNPSADPASVDEPKPPIR